jgi:nucleotide-binding universal stress UspA family protein
VSPFNNIALAQAALESERKSARELLHTAVAQAENANSIGAVPVREELVAGFPAAVLREKARDARIVVVGKPHDRNLTRVLCKTVTHKLTKHPPCRVVVVAADGSVASDTAFPGMHS